MEDGDRCHFQFEWVTSLACQETRAKITESHWKVTDPRTGGYMDLNLLDLQR